MQKRETIKIIENSGNIEFPPVQIKDIFRFEYSMVTRAGYIHQVGSKLFVLKATKDAPYNEISASGYNWICSTQFGISCWSTLESCISRGLLKKVG